MSSSSADEAAMRTGPVLKPGTCRWCRCTHWNPCPQGCGWADRQQTLCDACLDVDRAWLALKASRKPNMRRAFFLGFMIGADDERALGKDHTYRRGGDTAKYWQLGHDAGEAWSQG